MAPGYPLLLNVDGRRVLVVGGGAVGARRANDLAAAGAVVDLVAPETRADLDARIRVHLREFQRTDVGGAWLVHSCTGIPDVDAAVASACDARRTWCVRADAAGESAAWTPAVARADDVTVAVTAGADPRRAVAIRDAVRDLLALGELPVRRVRPG